MQMSCRGQVTPGTSAGATTRSGLTNANAANGSAMARPAAAMAWYLRFIGFGEDEIG
ncbi:hypothetical protein [Burkholderia ubonensis]|uniref:hypothetical protein n=1 Tax=Burkholderia ubonensis TaxID=101571 RepID=UPI000A60B288|nr:hypothetical protein [Burkholderia ubonensis]